MKDGTLRQGLKILSLFESTPNEQVQALLESGLLADLRDGNIAEVKRDEFRRLLGLKSLNPPFLETIGTIVIAATAEPFIASEKFVVDTGHKVEVRIAWLDGNFQNWFLGKTEAPAPEVTLKYGKLTRSALDDEICKEIGTESVETTLAAIYALMERQKNGKSGVLLTDGRANIFYVRDANGVLRAVLVVWLVGGGGWRVGARSVARQDGWSVGYRVFSRNS